MTQGRRSSTCFGHHTSNSIIGDGLCSYAITELQKDIETELLDLPEAEREAQRTKFAVFVVHNKLKPKVKELAPDIPYYAGAEVDDVWWVILLHPRTAGALTLRFLQAGLSMGDAVRARFNKGDAGLISP